MTQQAPEDRGLSPRLWIGIGVMVLIGIFIARNTEDANVTLVFFDATMALWLALTLAALRAKTIGQARAGSFCRDCRQAGI